MFRIAPKQKQSVIQWHSMDQQRQPTSPEKSQDPGY